MNSGHVFYLLFVYLYLNQNQSVFCMILGQEFDDQSDHQDSFELNSLKNISRSVNDYHHHHHYHQQQQHHLKHNQGK